MASNHIPERRLGDIAAALAAHIAAGLVVAAVICLIAMIIMSQVM